MGRGVGYEDRRSRSSRKNPKNICYRNSKEYEKKRKTEIVILQLKVDN